MSLSSPFRKNIPVRDLPKSLLYPSPSRPDKRGVRVVTNVGCGMRWTRQRQARLISRGRMMLMRTAKSCGPDAPTLASSLRDFSQATVARKPGHRGERDISVKTIARGMPGVSGVTVVTTLVCSFLFCMRGYGRIARPAFPAPSVCRGIRSCMTRARSAAGWWRCVPRHSGMVR
jgi:hypothetical protein